MVFVVDSSTLAEETNTPRFLYERLQAAGTWMWPGHPDAQHEPGTHRPVLQTGGGSRAQTTTTTTCSILLHRDRELSGKYAGTEILSEIIVLMHLDLFLILGTPRGDMSKLDFRRPADTQKSTRGHAEERVPPTCQNTRRQTNNAWRRACKNNAPTCEKKKHREGKTHAQTELNRKDRFLRGTQVGGMTQRELRGFESDYIVCGN